MSESESDHVIAHYGVKGMKWGVRRSQRQLDRARARREKQSDDANKLDDAKEKAKKSGVGVKALSNSELKAVNERLNLEKNYKDLTEGKSSKSEGQKFVEGIVKDVAGNAAKNYANQQVKELLKKTATGG